MICGQSRQLVRLDVSLGGHFMMAASLFPQPLKHPVNHYNSDEFARRPCPASRL